MDARVKSRPALGLALIAVLSLVLSACGLKTSSVTSVDDDFAGERVITVTLDKDDIKEGLNGTFEEAESIVAANVPSELTYSGSSTTKDGYKATFTLSFSSFDDYKEKVSSLLARTGKAEPVIERVQSSDGLVKGVQLSEDFTDKDLLSWMIDPLVSGGAVSEDNRGSIFDSGEKPVLKIGDQTYKSQYSSMEVRNLVDNRANSAMVTVDLRPDNYLQTRLVVGDSYGDQQWSRKQKPLVKEFLEARLPSGATISEDAGLLSREPRDALVVTFQPADVAELEAGLKQLTEKENNTVMLGEAEIGEQSSLRLGVGGDVDLTALAAPSPDVASTPIFITPEAWRETGDPVTDISGGELDGARAFRPDIGSSLVYLEMPIPIKSALVDLGIELNGSATTTVTFDVDKEVAGSYLDMMNESMGKLSEFGDYTSADGDGVYSHTLKFSGANAEELSDKLGQFENGAFLLAEPEPGGLFNKTTHYTLAMPLRMGRLAEYYDTPVTYRVTLPTMHKFVDHSSNLSEPTDKSSSKVLEWTDNGQDPAGTIWFSDRGPTIGTLITFGVLLALLVIAGIVAFIFRKRISAWLAKRKEERAKNQPPAPQYPQGDFAPSAASGAAPGALSGAVPGAATGAAPSAASGAGTSVVPGVAAGAAAAAAAGMAPAGSGATPDGVYPGSDFVAQDYAPADFFASAGPATPAPTEAFAPQGDFAPAEPAAHAASPSTPPPVEPMAPAEGDEFSERDLM